MRDWVEPALAGTAAGTAVFAVLLGPAVLMQSRAYGRVHLTRLLVIAAACIYACALLAYTVVPSADMAELCRGRSGGKLRIVPLSTIRDALADGAAGRRTILSWGAWQLAMNTALFIPLGVFARGLFGRSVPVAAVTGMLVSLLFETTQYTGFWGLYSCGIRVADIDDVLSNTLGTLAGALVGQRILGRWLPRARDLKQRMRERIGLDTI